MACKSNRYAFLRLGLNRNPIAMNKRLPTKAGLIDGRKKPFVTEDELEKAKEIIHSVFSQPSEDSWSYLYLVKSGSFYKIGYAFDLDSRLTSLQSGNPLVLTVEYARKVKNAQQTEKLLHTRFSNKRVRGEWFFLTDDDVVILKSLVEEDYANNKTI